MSVDYDDLGPVGSIGRGSLLRIPHRQEGFQMKMLLFMIIAATMFITQAVILLAVADTINSSICVSDSPKNKRCPVNINWVNCSGGDTEAKAKEICSLTYP